MPFTCFSKTADTNAAANINEVKEMAKFLNTWHMNPVGPWPTDPAETAKLSEMLFAMLDKALKEGELLEFGYFPNGTSGYAIVSGAEGKDMFRRAFSFYPWIVSEVREMIPYETGKEIMRAVMKAEVEQMAAMKR
jgi:hypothetical protein